MARSRGMPRRVAAGVTIFLALTAGVLWMLGGRSSLAGGRLLALALAEAACAWIAYHAACSQELDFLDRERPFTFVAREFVLLFWRNDPSLWAANYSDGAWDQLDSEFEKPRLDAIAELIQKRFPRGARVLDVGCGLGALYPLLRKTADFYQGIDVAPPAIERCKKIHHEDGARSFDVVAFEDFRAPEPFDVIVLSELLYYYPLTKVPSVFRRSLHLTKDDQSILIVSNGRHFMGLLVNQVLKRIATPLLSMTVSHSLRGQGWLITVYGKA